MTMQGTAVAVFIPTVVGAAAWTGSREGRLGVTELLTGTARPRWSRQLAAWAATTGWAVVAYLGCVAVLYGVTAQQATVGRAVVVAGRGRRGEPARTVRARVRGRGAAPQPVHHTAGRRRRVRRTRSHPAVHPRRPVVLADFAAGRRGLGTRDHRPGVATFYPYLPDLAIAQLIFLAGLTAALLGVLGLPAGSGGPALRRAAAAITAAGLLVAGTAVAAGRHRPAGRTRHDRHRGAARPGRRPSDPRTRRCAAAPRSRSA